jgi:hypothetical protein
VAQQQNPDGFATHARNQLSLHGLFSHQPHRPPGVAFRRSGADHSNDPLFLAIFQQRGRSRAFLLIDSSLEAALYITMPTFRIAWGVSGTNSAIRGALIPLASCINAMARSAARTG